MSGAFGYNREAIRIKVKKIDGSLPIELRKFSVDPQITSLEVLQSILIKAFDLKEDFIISYKVNDAYGHEVLLPMLSDWDLDAAFLKAHNFSLSNKCEPALTLQIDVKPFEECSEEWDVKQNQSASSQIQKIIPSQEIRASPRLIGIFNQVGKTINIVQKALNFGEDTTTSIQIAKLPLSDSEFRKYQDSVGQIINAKELRTAIYFGGIEPSLRKVVWKHLLNVYPKGMTGRERMDYIKRKADEYMALRETWKEAIAKGSINGELVYTTGMVKKDVLRTDRHHPFFAGNDDNQNIAALFNILTTYALNHPKVSYCQGMSDLASPLLVTMNNEAHAYICFCGLMERLCSNFMIDGIAMTQKFTHLAEAIMYYDPEFHNYLKIHQADDLLFCYRWLLLEMKREFAFNDSLRMLEVLWSSLPVDHPEKELHLYDTLFEPVINTTPPESPLIKTLRENPYTKVCALRRQTSYTSLSNSSIKNVSFVKRQNHSLDETDSKAKNNLYTINKHESLDGVALNNLKEISKKDNVFFNVNRDKLIPTPDMEARPRSVSPVKENTTSFNNKVKAHTVLEKSMSASLSSSMSSIINNTKKSNRLMEFKEKITSAKLFLSLDHLDRTNEHSKSTKKRITNLNEFLNFASVNKSKISEKIMRIGNVVPMTKPNILLFKSSFDDSQSLNTHSLDQIKSSSSTSNNCDESLDESSLEEEYFPLHFTMANDLRLEIENLESKVFGNNNGSMTRSRSISSNVKSIDTIDRAVCDDIFIWQNPLHLTSPKGTQDGKVDDSIRTPDEQESLDFENELFTNSSSKTENLKTDEQSSSLQVNEVSENKYSVLFNQDISISQSSSYFLPPPNEFGGGNPFLMFLCITLLLQHRDHIISKGMDYNEMAMHFDKMVRKHNVTRVLSQARQMYASYIKKHFMTYQKRDLINKTSELT